MQGGTRPHHPDLSLLDSYAVGQFPRNAIAFGWHRLTPGDGEVGQPSREPLADRVVMIVGGFGHRRQPILEIGPPLLVGRFVKVAFEIERPCPLKSRVESPPFACRIRLP